MFVRQYDVLLNTLGNGTLGRSGIVSYLPFPMLTDGHPFIFRTSNPESSYFLFYYLQLKRSDIEKAANGSTNQTFLNLSSTKLWPIPAAPIEEQKRIVAKIKELLPLVDRYEEAWSKLEKFNNEFPSDMELSIIKYALQGKLVEQNESEGNGFALFDKICEVKKELFNKKIIKKDKAIESIAEDDIPFEIP